jgi:hypothetical protein
VAKIQTRSLLIGVYKSSKYSRIGYSLKRTESSTCFFESFLFPTNPRVDASRNSKQVAPSITQKCILEIGTRAVAQGGNDHMKMWITNIQPSFLNPVQVRNIRKSLQAFKHLQRFKSCFLFQNASYLRHIYAYYALLPVSFYISVIK